MNKKFPKFLQRKPQTPANEWVVSVGQIGHPISHSTHNNPPINQPQQQHSCCNNPPQPAEFQRTPLQKSTLMKQICTSPSLIRGARVIRRESITTINQCETEDHVSTVLEKVGIENAVIIFLSMLAERRVIITGSDVTEVSRTVQAFVRLLRPLEWPHTLVPIVPDSQMDLFSNPMPYICGLLRHNLNRISELICPPANSNADYTMLNNDGITLLDVDRSLIVPPLSRSDKRIGLRPMLQHTAKMGFPRWTVCDLVSSFKGCLPVRDPEKADYKLEKSVMVWYAKLFGHYRKFMGLAARSRKLFASVHPCAETQLFLNRFIENGILQYFIATQAEATNTAPGLRLRFQEVLQKYAPPVTVTLDTQGRRRKRNKITSR